MAERAARPDGPLSCSSGGGERERDEAGSVNRGPGQLGWVTAQTLLAGNSAKGGHGSTKA